MPVLKTKKEVRGFLGRLNYITHCISQLTNTCKPIFKLLRKNNPEIWNEDCQEAFDKMKQYLVKPPLLVQSIPIKSLILYLTINEAGMGGMLGQHDDTRRKEQDIHYINKKFISCEEHYSMIKKLCYELAYSAERLYQYILYYYMAHL